MKKDENEMTAAEFMASLENDVEYQEMRRKQEVQRQADIRRIASDEVDLVEELNACGYSLKSVWDLVNTEDSYADLIPLLIKHLDIDHCPEIFEGIIRALITTDAIGYGPKLISKFCEQPKGHSEIKWLLGSAIALAATESDFDSILELIHDTSHGLSRADLPIGLVAADYNRAYPILKQLENVSDLAEGAKKALHTFS
ncbi:MAG: hypothetical protein AAGB26_04485 [Planctomycetota bacterium]